METRATETTGPGKVAPGRRIGRWASAALAAMLLVGCGDDPVSVEPGAVMGTVLVDQRPEPGVVVFVERGDSRREATSDGEGDYVIDNLPLGTYRVEVSPPVGISFEVTGFEVTLTETEPTADVDFSGTKVPLSAGGS